MNIQRYQPQVMKGGKITAQSFNEQLDTTKQVADGLNLEITRAQSGFISIEKQTWFSPRPNYKFGLDGGSYKMRLDSLVVGSVELQKGDVGSDGTPVGVVLPGRIYDRQKLALLDDPDKTYIFTISEIKSAQGISTTRIRQPEMDALEQGEQVVKAWKIAEFKCDFENDIMRFTINPLDGIDWNGGGGGEPYGVFRWQGNTGQTEGASPKPTGTATHCNFLFGRTPIHLDDIDGLADGTWYLKVEHDDPESATLTDTFGTNTPDKTYIPIFTIAGQKVIEDWRGAVTIPVWESYSY